MTRSPSHTKAGPVRLDAPHSGRANLESAHSLSASSAANRFCRYSSPVLWDLGRTGTRDGRPRRRICRLEPRIAGILDHAGAAPSSQYRPRPFQQHEQPVFEAREVQEVDERPDEFGRQAAQAPAPLLEDGERGADGSQITLVEVLEGSPRGLAGDGTCDRPARVVPALDGDLSQPRQRTAGVLNGRGVADHEDFGMSGYREIGLDVHPAGVIGRCPQPGPGWGRVYSRRPEHAATADALVVDDDAIFVDVLDARTRAHLDAHPLQIALRLSREGFRVGGEDARTGIDQDDSGGGWIDTTELPLEGGPCHGG